MHGWSIWHHMHVTVNLLIRNAHWSRRISGCDILQSLQNYLMGQIAKELECKSLNYDVLQEAHNESDSDDFTGSDEALYRLGGWALLSAKRFRIKYIKKNKGQIDYLKEEIQLLITFVKRS